MLVSIATSGTYIIDLKTADLQRCHCVRWRASCLVATAATGLSWNAFSFVLFRFMTGAGIGGRLDQNNCVWLVVGPREREQRRIIMTIMTRRMVGVSAFAVLFAASFAAAQAPEMVRVRGTIESVDGQMLTVKARDGGILKVKLADNAPIRAVVKASLADIKQGTFVGITAMPQPDGTQKAVEIHIFPEAMRGTGEGHRPWDLMPNSTMTNATVDSTVAGVDGQTLVLKYKDGEKTFIVPANVVVVTYASATMTDLKPGEKVFVAAAKKLPDSMLEAPNVTVGRDGVSPPM
jgi:hypothetical protein